MTESWRIVDPERFWLDYPDNTPLEGWCATTDGGDISLNFWSDGDWKGGDRGIVQFMQVSVNEYKVRGDKVLRGKILTIGEIKIDGVVIPDGQVESKWRSVRLAYIKMLLRGWRTTKSNFAWYLGLMAKAKTAWPDLYEKALTETWSGERTAK